MTRNLKFLSSAAMDQESYRSAGVDTDEADAGLAKLTHRIKATWPSREAMGGVQLDIGYFANVVNIGGIGVAITTDGIGSKAKIATMAEKFDTVGIDCVAMNVNDVICVGARPISMVDYVAVESINADVLDKISIGLCEGAKRAGISISGGETAQLKGMVTGFDLAGTAIGHVQLDRIIVGQNIKEGDVLIGVESNGIHSNGLSLARRAFFELNDYKLAYKFDEFGTDLATELLRPTFIYVSEALDLIEKVPSVKALIHITSDGFLNLNRVESPIGYVIDTMPDVPPIFSIIQKLARVADAEMFSVFNMGIGFCAIVSPADADTAISILGSDRKRAFRIGYAIRDDRRRVTIPEHNLVGERKHFRTVDTLFAD